MKKNGIGLLVVGLAFLWALNGCNVFDQAGSKKSDLDYQGLLLRGNSALDAGNAALNAARADTAAGSKAQARGDTAAANAAFKAGAAAFKSAIPHFKEALDFYESAMKVYPEGSEAYLFHAQAIVHLYAIDYNRINSEFKRADSVNGLPFIHGADTTVTNGVDTVIHAASTVQSIDSLYYPVNRAVDDLEHILRPAHDTLFLTLDHKIYMPPDSNMASDGRVSPSVARLDLGILSAVKALLVTLDLDQSGHIDSTCVGGADICPFKSNTSLSEVDRLNNFITLTSNLAIDTLDTKSLSSHAKDISNTPGDINGYVKSMQEPLASAAYNLDSVHSSFQSHGQTALSDNIAKTVNRIQDLSNFIGYIQYNNGIDDDNDAQNVAAPDTMRWHDFDNDKGIRFDYDDNSGDMYLPYTIAAGYNYGNPGDIGHPIHRYLKRGTIYLTYAEWTVLHPQLAKDTSANGRIPLMKKRCKTLVDSFNIVTPLPAGLDAGLRGACDTFSTVLKASVTSPTLSGGHSDWISGTAGVDEELLDGYDNDYDGITDEDSRNLRGYDDDKDATLNPCMVYNNCTDGSTLSPMQWTDLNGNHCIDIDKNHVTTADSARVFCIGTLENRLYLARKAGGTDSLRAYYEQVPSEISGDCIRDYNKRLDTAFKSLFKPTVTERDNACSYKHIWKSPTPPPNSEWTGGTFGVDEEICGDGIDNDGDGWVDEDCGSH